uniref:Mu transposase domain-containing protein n=1 Tax=Paenibacillus sp. FSL R10-2782 TaxID=2954661 RepID=UPI00406C549D
MQAVSAKNQRKCGKRRRLNWLDTIANNRLHGTTFRVPLDLWKEERLNPVSNVAFAFAERHHRKVSNDCYVSYNANRYTVPFAYAGSTIEIQDEKNRMRRFYCSKQLIAEHRASMGRHQIVRN